MRTAFLKFGKAPGGVYLKLSPTHPLSLTYRIRIAGSTLWSLEQSHHLGISPPLGILSGSVAGGILKPDIGSFFE